jgi:hypothetical protein
MKKFLLFSCLLLSICFICTAQLYERQLISPAGDYFAEADIQMTWVLGDLVTGAYDLGQLIVPYGVDVPPDNEVLSAVTLFPNPTSNKVYLLMEIENIQNFTFWLYDVLGREIRNGIITSEQTELDLTPFESGMYILRVIHEATLIQDFKIIKQ